jgi:hypothetical protein
MRLLAWNLNHRAKRRAIPTWISAAIAEQAADVVILTEYVEGPDHASFCERLKDLGLCHQSLSERAGKSNQLLIATKQQHERGSVTAPSFNEHVPPNFLHISIMDFGLNVIGFRMPAFTAPDTHFKRQTWDWLIDAIRPLAASPCLIAGDFNTAFGDPDRTCGDCLERLLADGWQRADPGSDAVSYRSRNGRGRLIDHAFASASIAVRSTACSWGFHRFGPDAQAGHVGRPDHAMVVVEYEIANRASLARFP